MICLKKEPNKSIQLVMVKNKLSALQHTVGGYIEVVPTKLENVVVICDEEGRIKGKEHCATIDGVEFVGTILIVGVDGEEFTEIPYSEQLARSVEKWNRS